MKIPFEKLNEIAQANNIVDVISSYIKVKKSGKNNVAVCPFHPDKNPSMSISEEKQVYHCFACKAGGNVFSFVQNYEKITFVDAAIKLATRAGIKLNFKSDSPDLSNEISRLLEINKIASKFFHKNLVNVINDESNFVWKYIKKRGINKQTITEFNLGFSNKSWDSLFKYFQEENNFTDAELMKSGLFKTKDNVKFYDTFRGRLMFPIFNESEKVIAFGARKLFDDDEIEGKYINTQETLLYNKSKTLYGLNLAKDTIRNLDYAIIVEGYLDMISLYMNGFHNVVASSGTALTKEQINILSRYTQNIVLIFDSDFAGVKASKAGLQLVLEAGLNLHIVTLPEGEDPDSFVKSKGKEEFEKQLNNKKSLIDFVSSLYLKEHKLNTPEDKTFFIKEIITFISKIPDKIKRSFYIKDIAKRYGLYESDLVDELNILINRNLSQNKISSSIELSNQKRVNLNVKKKGVPQEDKDIIYLLLSGDEDVISYIENNLELSFITTKFISDLANLMLTEYMNEGIIDARKLSLMIDSKEATELLSELSTTKYIPSELSESEKDTLLYYAGTKGIDKMKYAKDLIKKYRIRNVENKITELLKYDKDIDKILKLKQEILMIKNDIEQ